MIKKGDPVRHNETWWGGRMHLMMSLKKQRKRKQWKLRGSKEKYQLAEKL